LSTVYAWNPCFPSKEGGGRISEKNFSVAAAKGSAEPELGASDTEDSGRTRDSIDGNIGAPELSRGEGLVVYFAICGLVRVAGSDNRLSTS
jgi:hypothetical protein